MDMIIRGIIEAFWLLADGDKDFLRIVMTTLQVSGAATVISLLFGIPMGLWLALKDFPGKRALIGFVNFGMGFPPVVAGLAVSMFLWRNGPLGELNLMYTRTAMVIAQSLVAIPIVAGFSTTAILSLNPKMHSQLLSMGASQWQANRLLIKEARLGLAAAVIAGFGRIISEVGASMMVGGNIKGETRVLTTSIVLEVGKGNYDAAVAISYILLILTYCVIVFLTFLQHGKK